MRIGLTIFGVGVALYVVAWALLAHPFARDLRTDIVADILSRELGHPVVIDGDVSLSLSRGPVIVASGLRLPATGFGDVDLAYLNSARITLAPWHRMQGGVPLPRIEAEGLRVNLLRDIDGKTTWSRSEERAENVGAEKEDGEERGDLIAFLGARNIHFADMQVDAENRETGFVFDFDVIRFDITQPEDDGDKAEIILSGKMNDQPLEFVGDFGRNAALSGKGNLGSVTFSLNGQKRAGTRAGDFDGIVTLDTPDLGNVLDVLDLDGEVNGSGSGTLRLVRTPKRLDFDDINLSLDLANGAQARLTGSFGDLRFGPDFDLSLELAFAGKAAGGKTAIYLEDIRAEQITMRVVGADETITVENFTLETNAFDEEIREIGPFRVERVLRYPDGRLSLTGVTLVLGPPEAPYVFARGDVGNLLTLQDYALTGGLDLPARRLLLTLRPELAGEFGRLTGSLELEEIDGKPALSRFELSSVETDRWSAALDLTVEDLARFEGAHLDLRLATPDAAEFFDAIRLKPVDAGAFTYGLQVKRANQQMSAGFDMGLGRSTVEAALDLRIAGNSPVLRGEVKSPSVRMQDLRNGILAAIELSRLQTVYAESRSAGGTASGKELDDGFQPLVLPTEENETPQEDMSDFQPLVLADPSEEEDLSDYQPLVLSEGLGALTLNDIRNPRGFVRLVDADIDIAVDRIAGQPGISRLEGGLHLQDGQLRFGPIDLAYGGGQANLRAAVNLVETPEWVRLTGRTGGWNIGDILGSMGARPMLHGTLKGHFDLSGRYASQRAFLRSARGQATVEMTDGRISTSLIELAGLGVLPWLFSQEKRQGFSPVVCIKAPLRIDRGRIAVDTAVLETPKVQLVGSGTIDLVNDRISFRADPRPIGQPLARTAWPFEVTGALSAPRVKVAERVTRRSTVPLAMRGDRVPCVPDVAQLVPDETSRSHNRPR